MQPNTFNITTLLLMVLTATAMFMRYRIRMENSWPLIYYIALVAYTQKFDDIMNTLPVYVALACALLLRFEFMSGWILRLIMYVESACLAYVLVRCLQVLYGSG
jgi:hypothetical protein